MCSCTSTFVGGKRNNFFTLSAQFVESDPHGREIILLCRTLLPLLLSRIHSSKKKKIFQWIQERIQDRFTYLFSVLTHPTLLAHIPPFRFAAWHRQPFWHFMLGNVPSTNPFCVPKWLFGCLCFSPSAWMAPGLLTRWSSCLTSYREMSANFGLSAQYLSCPHFGTKPCWVRNTASVLYKICWHLCDSDHLSTRGRKLGLSAL